LPVRHRPVLFEAELARARTEYKPAALHAVIGHVVMAPIRGRDDEVAAVRQHIGAVIQGRGGVVVVEGPPGIGKTRLLGEFVALAEKAGMRPLFGECFEYGQTAPFAPLFTATLRADPPVGDVEGLRRVDDADLRDWVVNDLQVAIGAAARKQPLAIILDNVYWADNGTLLALQLLTASLADAPVLWMVSACTGGRRLVVGETVGVLKRQGALVMRLGAVSACAVADIVQDVVRATADVSLLNLACTAHGNPFLLMELIRGLLEEDRITITDRRATATGEALPQRVTATMQQRLDRLSPDARRVVQVASVLPDRFSAAVLATMLESRPVALISALDEAVRADLLTEEGDRLRFRHDLLRQATRQSVPAPLRRALEREAVKVLLDGGVPPEEVAAQLARSAELGDQAAVAVLRRAAKSAGSDPSAAADLSRRAVELLPRQDPARAPVVAETILLLNQAMRDEEARELAAETLSGDLSADEEAQVRLGLASMVTDPPERRAQENLRALALSPVNDLTRARHRGWLAFNLMMNGQSSGAREAAEAASVAASDSGDTATRLLAEAALANIDCADGYPRRAVQRLRQLDPLIHGGSLTAVHQVAAVNQANLLITSGLLEEAAAAVAEGTRAAARNRNDVALHHFTQVQGLWDLAAGRLSEAREGIESLPAQVWMKWTGIGCQLGLATLAQVAVHTGDCALMRQILLEARDACANGGPAVQRQGLAALAHAAWGRGDVEEAGRRLGPDFPLLQTPLCAVDLDHIVLAARIARRTADTDLRTSVLHAVEILNRESPAMPLFSAVAQHARAILAHDAEALLALLHAGDSYPRPLLHAAAAEDAGNELAPADRPKAVDALNVAFEIYTQCQAIADAQRVGRALRALGAPRRIVRQQRAKTGLNSLTDSELRVAHLVADGATNQAVAQRLCVSPHTVNTHLRNVFAKLRINSRIELSQLLNRPRQTAS
jgi:DNA-binding CsgD family transcriptional regulator